MAVNVIVGGGLAGASAAIALRELSPDAAVVLIGAETEPPYERPPLSKAYLRGTATFAQSLVRPAEFYADHRIETRFGSRVTRIDPTARMVHLEGGGQMSFDALLIATGARNRKASIPGGDLAGIHSLRTRQDADRIRDEMQPGRRAVVVGMGFIGSEVAASLRHERVDVVAIDPAKTPLLRVLGEGVGQTLADLHRSYGVRTLFEDTVAAFEGTARVACVVTRAGQRIPCDFVVLGIGVEPVVDLLGGSGIGVDNGVVVDEYCRTNVSGIYAAGDVANHYHPVFERHIRVEHWQNAMKQGVNAARNMRGERVPYDEIPWFWSDQYDANLQYAGYHTAWDDLVVRGRLDAGSYTAFYMNDGRIDAVVSLNNAKDVRRTLPLIKDRRRVDPAQLRDESVDLRVLRADPSTTTQKSAPSHRPASGQ